MNCITPSIDYVMHILNTIVLAHNCRSTLMHIHSCLCSCFLSEFSECLPSLGFSFTVYSLATVIPLHCNTALVFSLFQLCLCINMGNSGNSDSVHSTNKSRFGDTFFARRVLLLSYLFANTHVCSEHSQLSMLATRLRYASRANADSAY